MKRLSDNNKKTVDKIHNFLNANNWIIAIGIILTFGYLSLKIGSVLDMVKNNELTMKEDVGKVIFLTSDGRVMRMQKQPVSYADKRMTLYIANLVQTHLIQDLVSISKGFKVSYTSGYNLVNRYKAFKDFEPYLLNKNWIYQYANNILLLISNDNYPEYINPYDRKIVKFVILDPKTNTFKIVINFKVIKRSYLRELTTANKYKTAYSTISFKATGFFNVDKYGSLVNPFGLKFTNINITLLTKR